MVVWVMLEATVAGREMEVAVAEGKLSPQLQLRLWMKIPPELRREGPAVEA